MFRKVLAGCAICLTALSSTPAKVAPKCTAQFKKGKTPDWVLKNHRYGVNYEWYGREFDDASGQLYYYGPRNISMPEGSLTNFSEGCRMLKRYQGD